MTTSRASTTRLANGEHSIDRVKPVRREEGGWALHWSVRLHTGKLLRKTSKGSTQGQAKSRAKAKAAELLATGAAAGKTSDPLDTYIREQVRPALEENRRLSAASRRQYLRALTALLGECEGHKHSHALTGLSIADGTRFRALEACLKEIVELHGHESGHQARTVLSGYIMPALKRDELIVADPIKGERLDLGQRPEPVRGGKALTADQRQRIIDHLLELDPETGLKKQLQGRYPYEVRVARRLAAIDLTLLQACTGARVSEANGMESSRHFITQSGRLIANLTRDIVKGGKKPRAVPFFFDDGDRVAERLAERAKGGYYLIGAPADRSKVWDATNCRKTVRGLYDELADELDIPLLKTELTHVWRATLNTMTEGIIPEARRAALFGHDAEVNRQHYLDLTDVTVLLDAAKSAQK